MTDDYIINRIISVVKNGTWKDIKELGINMQQAIVIRNSGRVRFRQKTIDRIRAKWYPNGDNIA